VGLIKNNTMAKAILKFDLNDPDDRIEYMRCNKSLDMALALWELCHNTKKGLGYSMEGKEMDQYETLTFVFDKIYEIIDEHNINFDEIMR
jgi:hypothetical protein